MRAQVLKLREECNQSDTNFGFALARKAIYKAILGKRITAHHKAIIKGAKNIQLDGNLLRVGTSYVGFMAPDDRTYLNIQGKLKIKGDYSIGRGCRLHITPNAVATFGKGFINSNTCIVVDNELEIGEGTAISWGCQILDTDFHKIDYPGRRNREHNKVTIGNNVLICCNATILKGVSIPDGCIIAAGSVVTREFYEPNTLIAGSPARVIKQNVAWE